MSFYKNIENFSNYLTFELIKNFLSTIIILINYTLFNVEYNKRFTEVVSTVNNITPEYNIFGKLFVNDEEKQKVILIFFF